MPEATQARQVHLGNKKAEWKNGVGKYLEAEIKIKTQKLSCVLKTFWSRKSELNRRPTDYESVALPLSYFGTCLSLRRLSARAPAVKHCFASTVRFSRIRARFLPVILPPGATLFHHQNQIQHDDAVCRALWRHRSSRQKRTRQVYGLRTH